MKAIFYIVAAVLVGLGFERLSFAQNHGLGAMPMGGYEPVIGVGLGLIICGAAAAVMGSRAK